MGKDCFVCYRMCRNTLVSLHWAGSTLLQLWQSKCHRLWHMSPWDNAILPPLPGESHDSTVICLNLSCGNSVKISSVFVFLPGLGSYSLEKNIHPPAQQPTELLISWEPVGKGTLRASILSTYPLLFARIESLSWHRRGQKLNHAFTFVLYLEEHSASDLTPQPQGHIGISDSCSWGPLCWPRSYSPGPAQLVHFVLFRI